MTYVISFKRSFLSDYVQLGRNMQKRINFAVAEVEQKPVTPRAATIKNLKYHERLWRYRIGDYRMVYAAYPEKNLVQLLGIGPRGEIYDRLGYHPDEPQYENYSEILEEALDPGQEKPVEWLQYLQPDQEAAQSQDLPYRLTPDLLSRWGIPQEYHPLFEGCETEDQLQNCGAPESYIFRLMDCLWPATAEEIVDDPNYVLQNPQDLARYASGDLRAFLLLLDKDQENLTNWALQGPTLVKGGPGSGKSTVAMYRVRELIKAASKEKQDIKVLYTTYTNALVEYSRQLIEYLLEDIEDDGVDLQVTTLDKIAYHIVQQVEGRLDMASRQELLYALASGRANLTNYDKNLKIKYANLSEGIRLLGDDYLLEEIEWVIEGQGIETLRGYLDADRTGRGVAMDQRTRSIIWLLYENYQKFLKTLGKTSWAGLRRKAFQYVKSGQWEGEKWGFVIVDEAQDLTPVALALCLEICQSPEGIFLTADASQSIYNKGFAWKNVHDSMRVTGRTRILRRNYRTTRQIALAAHAIIRHSGAGDEEALDQTYIHVGPKPTMYESLNSDEGYTWLANQLKKAVSELKMPLSSIAVLGPHNWMVEEAAEKLSNYGLDTTYVSGNINLETPSAKAMTLHSSKGLEFPIVALIYIEEDFIPYRGRDQRIEDMEKHLAKENRLLFVGMTRAMRRLFVLHRQGRGSSFLRDLDPSLWQIKRFS
ncbi:MAG: UvrD-helicase domain-containing protein [Anaerolineaceae bacterium]|nr:UvrD-helicase domain-containing protein [Anaerolineaceae bacterium]